MWTKIRRIKRQFSKNMTDPYLSSRHAFVHLIIVTAEQQKQNGARYLYLLFVKTVPT
jgi:hypothetical protein